MDDASRLIRNNKILEIFNTMEYGDSLEDTDAAVKWLNGAGINDKSSEIDSILKHVKNKFWNAPAVQRATILNKLSAEVEKNKNLFAQIEILSRGILAKDTKNKSIQILSEFFAYYSSFAVKYEEENPKWKPAGVAVAVFDDENVLWNLGLVLAPALAAGYAIILQTGCKLSKATGFLLELANKVGIPEELITHIPSDMTELQPYLSCAEVEIIALFASLHNEKIEGFNKFNKKVLNFASHKTPMVVFDCADLDSAADSIVDAAWGYQGMLPWSVNTVVIQENIFAKFTNKLKSKLLSIKIGNGNDNMADISFPQSSQLLTNLLRTLQQAESQGTEVFQSKTDRNSLIPTLLIGSRVRPNNVLKADVNDNTVTLLAFRTPDEAVNLANNCKQGIGASVWAENVGLVNEVVRKLQVCNVWINNHGLITPYVTISPIKESGSGYFGGEQGFYEYVQTQCRCHVNAKLNENRLTEIPQEFNSNVINAISSGKKAQVGWGKTSQSGKRKVFQQVISFIESTAKNSLSKTLPEDWLDTWTTVSYKILSHSNTQNNNGLHYGYDVASVVFPRGVVAIETRICIDDNDMKLILAALYEGNSIILLNRNTEAQGFLEELGKKFPSGIFNVFSYSLKSVKATSLHKELNYYIGTDANPVYGSLPIQDTKVFSTVTRNLNDVYRKVTYVKNIWCNIGYSHQCTF